VRKSQTLILCVTFQPDRGLWAFMQKLNWNVCCRDFYALQFDEIAAIRVRVRKGLVLASKWNDPLRRAMEKGRYNKQRFVQSARFCEWQPWRFAC